MSKSEIWFDSWEDLLLPDQVVDYSYRPSRVGRRALGFTAMFIIGMSVAVSAEIASGHGDPSPESKKPLVIHEQQELSERVVQGLLYDHYMHKARVFAEVDNVEACQAEIAKLADIAIGPVTFDCEL